MPHSTGLRGRELIKGHATLNDFLMQVAISGADIAAACDRHRGSGADGFVRVVRTTALPGGGAFAASVPEAEWFLDYYRADGTVAEMSGNAARLFAHVLDHEGLCPIADGESVTIGTRGGARTITRLGELWTVDMGPARLASPEEAEDEGWDTAVVVPGLDGPRAALSVEIAGPHTVVALGEEGELEAAAFAGLTDSADPVAYEPAPEVGTNLELVVPLGEETDPDTQSSVGIAGVGESLSYGAGCCAVAVALHAWTGPGAPEDYRLLVPGGEIGVHVGADPLGEDGSVLLTGPATITGRITVA